MPTACPQLLSTHPQAIFPEIFDFAGKSELSGIDVLALGPAKPVPGEPQMIALNMGTLVNSRIVSLATSKTCGFLARLTSGMTSLG